MGAKPRRRDANRQPPKGECLNGEGGSYECINKKGAFF
jgi:hypothetical protein